jgi:hypothetical protein
MENDGTATVSLTNAYSPATRGRASLKQNTRAGSNSLLGLCLGEILLSLNHNCELWCFIALDTNAAQPSAVCGTFQNVNVFTGKRQRRQSEAALSTVERSAPPWESFPYLFRESNGGKNTLNDQHKT